MMATSAAMAIPAAMALVRKYAETRDPHGIGKSLLYTTFGCPASVVTLRVGVFTLSGPSVRSMFSQEFSMLAGSRHRPPSSGRDAASGARFVGSAPLYQRFGIVPRSRERCVRSPVAIIIAILLVGSSRSPAMIDCSGQTTTQAGSSPTSTRCTQ